MAIRASTPPKFQTSEIVQLDLPRQTPYLYQNQLQCLQQIMIVGGEVAEVCISHNGESFEDTGQKNGTFIIRPFDYICVSYNIDDKPLFKIHNL